MLKGYPNAQLLQTTSDVQSSIAPPSLFNAPNVAKTPHGCNLVQPLLTMNSVALPGITV
jgi:hypothetical protein